MSRRVKQLMIQEMAEKFRDVPEHGCVLVDYMGMSAAEAEDARSRVAEAGAQMNVVKNAMFNYAMKELGVPELSELVDGPTAVIVGDNPVQSAKLADELADESEAVELCGGYVSGKVADAAEVEKLAQLPGRQELLGQVARGMQGPVKGFATAMHTLVRKFAVAVDELREQREEEGE
jgi:large subunit ribosomal protein L10